MPKLGDIIVVLEQLAPLALAESWDNVGLLVGDRNRVIQTAMTCLTITPESVAEAVDRGAELIVTHHPLPFRPVQTITSDTAAGKLLLELIGAGIAVYSAHTAYDSAHAGINQHLAHGLGLQEIEPLVPADDGEVGSGRFGLSDQPQDLRELAYRTKTFLNIDAVRVTGDDEHPCTRVAIACGSGGSFLAAAHEAGCDAMVTGEASFHSCLEAKALGIGLILAGHFASERFALVSLADYLSEQIAGLSVWASGAENDPLRTV